MTIVYEIIDVYLSEMHCSPHLFMFIVCGIQDNMLFCDSCDRGFHMECCDPPLTRMPKGK